MKCLSCRRVLAGPALFFRNKLVLCEICKPLADKAAEDLEAYLVESRIAAYLCLEHSILDGGLLRPGSGMEQEDFG